MKIWVTRADRPYVGEGKKVIVKDLEHLLKIIHRMNKNGKAVIYTKAVSIPEDCTFKMVNYNDYIE